MCPIVLLLVIDYHRDYSMLAITGVVNQVVRGRE